MRKFFLITAFVWLGSAALAIAGDTDVPANEDEILAACMSVLQAQEVYRRTDYDRDGVLEYAQTLRGGKRAPPRLIDTGLVPAADEQERAQIAGLIAQLSAPQFAARENASAALQALGAKAVPQLRETQQTTKDAEVLARTGALIDIVKHGLAPRTSTALLCGLFRMVGQNGAEIEIQLIDRELAEAECPVGTDPRTVTPFNGYLFRVLTQQGTAALGGARGYVMGGQNMTLGHGLLAFPKEYGKTGRKCYVVNNVGTLYARDFGSAEATAAFVKDAVEFNPVQFDEKGQPLWQPVK